MKKEENIPADLAETGKLACESCGAEFACNAGQETCWCFEVEVSTEKSEDLRANFKNCLCKDCLEKIRVNK